MNKENKILSPCVAICSMAEEVGLCRGCLRTAEEIRQWNSLNDDAKSAILTRLEERRRTTDPDSLAPPYA